MNTFVLVLELIGTVAFAISGAVIGMEKRMDAFGVAILGLTVSVGGGVIRDLILGITPPRTFQYPIYAAFAIGTSILVFLSAGWQRLIVNHVIYHKALLLMDSLGLGIFTVVGISLAMEVASDANGFLLVFVGVISGVGGGVLRDILAQNMPYIFVKHIYACASLAGAIVCVLIWPWLGRIPAMLISASIILVLRLLAAHLRWNLPKAKGF